MPAGAGKIFIPERKAEPERASSVFRQERRADPLGLLLVFLRIHGGRGARIG